MNRAGWKVCSVLGQVGDERFRANGIEAARVFSSQWWRCFETARLPRLGPVEVSSVLDAFFQCPERRDAQTKALKDWLATQTLRIPVVLVTHQVSITALTEVYPSSGEIVLIRADEGARIELVGRISPE